MSDHSATEGTVEADTCHDLFDALLTHASWPVPPAAWGRLFVAAAALSELSEPTEPHPDGRMAGAGLRLMIRILDRVHRDLEDQRQIRAFLPLVRGRSKPVDGALRRAEDLLRNGDLIPGREGAAALLEQLTTDATGRMIRGLTKGVGEDQAAEDRPDLAEELRNPYELADRLDLMRELLTRRLADLIIDGDPQLRFLDRFAVLVPLAEASAELRGTRGLPPTELRVWKTDETLMTILETLGPDLLPPPVKRSSSPDPNLRRRRRPENRGPALPLIHNPYRLIREIGHRSPSVRDALNRLRDHVRSAPAEDVGVVGRGRLALPKDVSALTRTLRRIQTET